MNDVGKANKVGMAGLSLNLLEIKLEVSGERS